MWVHKVAAAAHPENQENPQIGELFFELRKKSKWGKVVKIKVFRKVLGSSKKVLDIHENFRLSQKKSTLCPNLTKFVEKPGPAVSDLR